MGRAEDIFEDIKNRKIMAIDDFILNAASEEYFLDFKRSHDNGGGPRLHDNDLKSLAKAISGFGNSEGGVIVWGIDCSGSGQKPDVANAKFPLTGPSRFKAWIDGAVSGRTVPAHQTVESAVVLDGGDTHKGFVVTLIPKSNNVPHQAIPDGKYYMRAGSSFVGVPHGVLQGMFGRSPHPNVQPKIVCSESSRIHTGHIQSKDGKSERFIKFDFHIYVYANNLGPGLANNVFIISEIIQSPGDKSNVYFRYTGDERYYYIDDNSKLRVSAIMSPSLYLPPEVSVSAFYCVITLSPPFLNDLLIKVQCGSSGSQTYQRDIHFTKDEVENTYNELKARFLDNTLNKKDFYKETVFYKKYS